jgi:hypothetical protein
MSNWIEEEAEKYHREKEEQLQKDELLNNSNHWLILRQQIERDVNELNNHAVWKELLGGIPVVVQNLNDGFQIQKTTYPAIYVTVHVKDRQLEMQTEINDTEGDGKQAGESLQLDVDKGKIVLRKDQILYLMPHEASRYLISPVIRTLKK